MKKNEYVAPEMEIVEIAGKFGIMAETSDPTSGGVLPDDSVLPPLD